MQTADACVLASYRKVAQIAPGHDVYLVQQIYSGKFYVMKELQVYSRAVFDYVRANPIANMPAIVELVEDGGRLTVIEEYMAGDTLQYMLDNTGTLDEDTVIRIALQLCAILRQLHDASPAIIHRDIKPANIILSQDGVVKLLDINAARQYLPEQSKDTRMFGTVGYAAPEQYGFMQSSIQTDIYSLGVLMNVLLTGQLPGQTIAGGRLHPIIARCVQMSPKDRYSSVAELQSALVFLMTGNAAAKPRDTLRYPWQKFLPPGIRSLRIPDAVFAACGYAFVYWLTLSLRVENGSAYQTAVNRIIATTLVTLWIFFSGNYLGVQRFLPLTRSRNKLAQLIGILIYDFLIMVLVLLLGASLGM